MAPKVNKKFVFRNGLMKSIEKLIDEKVQPCYDSENMDDLYMKSLLETLKIKFDYVVLIKKLVKC